MSTTKPVTGSGWTDRERLAYLLSLLEHSDGKLNLKTSPLPAGRSAIACERMLGRLKASLREELNALKSGLPMPATNGNAGAKGGAKGSATKAAKATNNSTARKRKVNDITTTAEGEGGDAMKGAKKRGREGKDGDEDEDEGDEVVKREDHITMKEEEEEEEFETEV
ncbi:hypothetical protein EKO04_005591 [Ascochyta lentis]|uniref:Uncharacterized protein n=1 Tax=Ascochyta lentis TaxID=205686 RepID=A0A8H7J4M6_9PLEO|nr:hypothetical protein EKO04_005591 [Ascochyta lentis]